MLRFAYWAGLGGVICSLGLALSAWTALPFASHAAPYIVLFVSIFITFAPAIVAHPARTRSGANVGDESRAGGEFVLVLSARRPFPSRNGVTDRSSGPTTDALLLLCDVPCIRTVRGELGNALGIPFDGRHAVILVGKSTESAAR